jgi:hypothetical protein
MACQKRAAPRPRCTAASGANRTFGRIGMSQKGPRTDIAPIKYRYLSGSLAAVGEAAVAIECETEMRCQRSDGRALLRIRIGIRCGTDMIRNPAVIVAIPWQHRCSQCIALAVAQREEKWHLSLYMGLEAAVALDSVGPLRTPGPDCLSPARGGNISRLCGSSGVTHAPLRLLSRYETGSCRSARRKHTAFVRPAIAAILGRRACKAN